jgi:phosphoglycolate phosphatase-like HAD superfamily hydrolase
MAQLLLRGVALGEVKGVLFDKDGTLSISEPQLITLAEARVFLCLERVDPALQGELRQLLCRAYGLRRAATAPGNSICPAGITAVASRDHNLIATATALVQVGLGWPEALSLSEQVFALADQLDARRAADPTQPCTSGEASSPIQAGKARAARRCAGAGKGDAAAGAHPAGPGPAGDQRPGPGAGMDAGPGPAGLATHLDSAGLPTGGTSRTTEGLRTWLEQLRSASVICAVISNDDVAGIEHFLASHELTDLFAGIWSAEHSPRKPDPAALHGLCAELGLTAADCALIGDANSDLRMAVAAGIPHQLALGYTAAWSTPPPLAEAHPRVHHWRELSLA